MKTYRVLWLGVLGVLAALGTAWAVMLVPLGGLIGAGVFGLLAAFLAGVALSEKLCPQGEDRDDGVARVPTVWMLRIAPAAVVGTVALVGLLTVLGPVTIVVVALLAACSPPVLQRVPNRAPRTAARAGTELRSTPTPADAPRPPADEAPVTESGNAVTDAELCRRWRTSYLCLQHAIAPDQRLRLIQTRSGLLDELARRDPEGFARWMNSGARAASDPTRFVTGSRRPSEPRKDSHDSER